MQEAERARSRVAAPVVTALSAILIHPRFPIGVGALTILAVLPSLWGGWTSDDHFHRLALADGAQAKLIGIHNTDSPTGLYTFLNGDPAQTHRLMDVGVAPWWTFEGAFSSFFRPVAWVTHWLDYRLWPDSSAAMHAQSILWYAALAVVVAHFYRRVMGPTCIAGLAALFYALDETHVIPAGWLANRSALIATFFGLLTLIAHDRWRRHGRRAGAIWAPILLAIALLSSEGGVATLAYLGSYALFLEKCPWRRRLSTLVSYALVVVVWRVVWNLMGFGTGVGACLYVDPLAEPLRYVSAVVERAPVLILAQWAWPPADMSVIAVSTSAYVWAIGAAFTLILIVVVVVPLARQDESARFWGVSAGLSLLPACSSLPSDRNLLFVGVGAMGLVAQFLGAHYRCRGSCADKGAVPAEGNSRVPVPASLMPLCGFVAVIFVLAHGIVSPIALPIRAAFPLGSEGITRQLHLNLPAEASLDQQHIVVVNGPSALHVGYFPIRRANEGHTVPRHTHFLSPSMAAVAVTRRDERTLVIRPRGGYVALNFDQIYRDIHHPMSLGQRVELTGLTVEVTALTDDGRPAEAAFHFRIPLEDESLVWLKWEEETFVPYTLPGIGETEELPAPIPSIL